MQSPANIPEAVAEHRIPREFALVPIRDCPFRDGLPVIQSAADAVDYFWRQVAVPPGYEPHVESLFVLILDATRKLLGHYLVGKGQFGSAQFTLGQVLLPIVAAGGSELIAIHNHPGGDIEPSPADLSAANRMRLGADLFSIALGDFIIAGLPTKDGGAGFSSLRELGALEKFVPPVATPEPQAGELERLIVREPELLVLIGARAEKEGLPIRDYIAAFLVQALRLQFLPMNDLEARS